VAVRHLGKVEAVVVADGGGVLWTGGDGRLMGKKKTNRDTLRIRDEWGQ
jgi:hypothetical protein